MDWDGEDRMGQGPGGSRIEQTEQTKHDKAERSGLVGQMGQDRKGRSSRTEQSVPVRARAGQDALMGEYEGQSYDTTVAEVWGSHVRPCIEPTATSMSINRSFLKNPRSASCGAAGAAHPSVEV